MKEPNLFTKTQAIALSLAAGGVAALQAMKYDMFILPDNVRLVVGSIISIFTIFFIWISGHEFTKFIIQGKNILDRLREEKEKEKTK